MSGHAPSTKPLETKWVEVASLPALRERGRRVVKVNGRQIALFCAGERVFACNNRCPHEGYPLVEGSLGDCVLTCNWHNWKFDLASGETLLGGETLRRYPVRIAGDAVLLDLSDPPPAARQAAAMAQLRGARATGLGIAALEAPLARAALAHYQDFGHAAIYLVKTRALIERLGPGVETPLLLALVRELVTAFREDLIPEFRSYGAARAAWDGTGHARPAAEDFRGLGLKEVLARALAGSGDPPALYRALLGAAAWQLLHFDLRVQARSDGPVSGNAGWLDVTHAVTFVNAGRQLAERHSDLWPAVVLQLACFVGRNAGWVDATLDARPWAVGDPAAFWRDAYRGLFDHAQAEPIVSAHLVKTLSAAEQELAAAPDAPWASTLLAALNRFLHSPLKRRHALREARQVLAFVAVE